ncbi:hypothetical protein L1987_17131 [Smallanthus sonchifolius]|uniref:Uncharacterized protein n=1 Tax=Smallanthus sonchifolius TaxID=185202 RepID=A0ACB9IW18_9ASTR|nr:hypothetical protein L1987_17131 [Smallanthus sonchifolius]
MGATIQCTLTSQIFHVGLCVHDRDALKEHPTLVGGRQRDQGWTPSERTLEGTFGHRWWSVLREIRCNVIKGGRQVGGHWGARPITDGGVFAGKSNAMGKGGRGRWPQMHATTIKKARACTMWTVKEDTEENGEADKHLSNKARPKPRSAPQFGYYENLGQRLQAKLLHAEQKRTKMLWAKRQRVEYLMQRVKLHNSVGANSNKKMQKQSYYLSRKLERYDRRWKKLFGIA